MSDIQWIVAILINAAVLIASFLTASIRTTWKLAQIEADIVKLISDHGKEDLIEFANIRNEIDATARSFGETIQALRQKTNDVELDSARLYVRRDGFHDSIRQLTDGLASIRGEVTGNITALRHELREDLKRMESKIDSKT